MLFMPTNQARGQVPNCELIRKNVYMEEISNVSEKIIKALYQKGWDRNQMSGPI